MLSKQEFETKALEALAKDEQIKSLTSELEPVKGELKEYLGYHGLVGTNTLENGVVLGYSEPKASTVDPVEFFKLMAGSKKSYTFEEIESVLASTKVSVEVARKSLMERDWAKCITEVAGSPTLKISRAKQTKNK